MYTFKCQFEKWPLYTSGQFFAILGGWDMEFKINVFLMVDIAKKVMELTLCSKKRAGHIGL